MSGWRNKGPELEAARAELERYRKITSAYTVEQCQEIFLHRLSRYEMERLFRGTPLEKVRDIAGEFLYMENRERREP